MLRFRAKTKVRYAILLCFLSSLSVYAIARLTGWCCDFGLRSVPEAIRYNKPSETLRRRSFTAKWHDSRELLNDLSDTQKMANVRAKFLRHLGEKQASDAVVAKVPKLPVRNEMEMKASEEKIAEDAEQKNHEERVLDAKPDNIFREGQGRKGKDAEIVLKSRSEDEQRQSQVQFSSLKGRKERDNVRDGSIKDVSRDGEHAEHGPGRNQQENKNYKVEKAKQVHDQNKGENLNHSEERNTTVEPRISRQMANDKNITIHTQSGELNYGKMRRSNRTIFDPRDSEIQHQVLRDSDSAARSLINQSRQVNSNEAGDIPMTPSEAVAQYGDRLPPWERFEIFHYPKIYYLGLRANKTQLTSNATNNYGFDHPAGTEEEGHYRVVEGDHIGYRYEILKYLGAGTFGAVVLARDWSNPSARDVALKIMHYDEDLKYIVREMNMNKYIEANASNIDYFPHMIATFQFRNHYCMVLELLGRSLDRHNVGTVRNMTTFRKYAYDILMGMQLMNELNIVHGDLKPDNILFLYGKNNQSKGQLLKVADFGISCIPGSKEFKCPVYYLQTRYYRAPEVILSLNIDPRVDMFSVGVIFAELYLGVPPFFGETETDQLAAMMEVLGLPPTFMVARSPRKKVYSKAMCYETENGFHRKPFRKPLTKVLKGMDPGLFDLIARCLEYDPKYRITPRQALKHPFLTEKYPLHGFPPPLSIQRLEGNA